MRTAGHIKTITGTRTHQYQLITVYFSELEPDWTDSSTDPRKWTKEMNIFYSEVNMKNINVELGEDTYLNEKTNILLQ